MSITTLKLLQFITMFVLYTGLTVVLPRMMFRRYLAGRPVSQQFLMCYTFGNFYIINIVFLFQLLHISNFWTLSIGTIVFSILIKTRVEKTNVRGELVHFGTQVRRIFQGKLGKNTLLFRWGNRIRGNIKEKMYLVRTMLVGRPIQGMFLIVLMAVLVWVYGRQLWTAFGYCASDIPVHMSWINQMSRDNLFSAGVYPFGFHCIVYYLHAVFGMDVYVILCQFFMVQVIYAHLVIVATLKMLCKTKYLPYAASIVYALCDIWQNQTYGRYFSSLPQELAMLFIYPSIAFLIAFFRQKKEDLKKQDTYIYLACFAMAFGLTLSVHFYGTMIAGLCCVGIGLAFFPRFVRKEYFCRIMLTGILSVFIAVLPMGIAFATGTPLQGSLGWGMSVIQGGKNSEETESTEVENSSETEEPEESESTGGSQVPGGMPGAGGSTDPDGTQTPGGSGGGNLAPETEMGSGDMSETEDREDSQGDGEESRSFIDTIYLIAGHYIGGYIFRTERPLLIGGLVLFSFVLLAVLGLVLCILKEREYGMGMLGIALSMGILTCLLASRGLGLLTLMDAARCSIFFSYLLIMVPALLLDGGITLLFGKWKWKWIPNLVSLIISVVILIGMVGSGHIKRPTYKSDFVTNGAILCLDNIIHENEDATWTIVSANDETQMGLDHGWHYEIITFLRKMEFASSDTQLTIPTKTVYFFIEKIPLNYTIVYPGSGQSISEEGAKADLPTGGGLGVYQGERRWIVMSRMYAWAQEFAKQYPNEFTVYYESDEFICYRMEQNMYNLCNFAIDYGYNTYWDREATEE